MSDPHLVEAAEHYRRFCNSLGIDVASEDTMATPMRVAKVMRHFTAAMRPMEHAFTTFSTTDSNRNQLVNVCGIRLVSLCSHHHMPFIGLAHVCYLPNKVLAGLSKLPRLIRWISKQPTMQETLTSRIISELRDRLQPRFIGVRIIAEHTCMSVRGVEEANSMTSTDAFWCDETEIGKQGRPLDVGDYETTKQEFFRAINEWYHAKGHR
jgi:GTP cyclohydrolase IA